jgi:hypothetical protein
MNVAQAIQAVRERSVESALLFEAIRYRSRDPFKIREVLPVR